MYESEPFLKREIITALFGAGGCWRKPTFFPPKNQAVRSNLSPSHSQYAIWGKRLVSTALTKADMAESLFNELGLNKKEAREPVALYFKELRACLVAGKPVKLSGFGNFDLRDKNERSGRNPKTGEKIPIPARRVVKFRPGKKLQSRVKAYAGTGK